MHIEVVVRTDRTSEAGSCEHGRPGRVERQYEVPEGGADEVTLLVVDMGGNVAYKVIYDTQGDEELEPGIRVIPWDVMNSEDVKVASGLYQGVIKIKSGLTTDVYSKNFIVIW